VYVPVCVGLCSYWFRGERCSESLACNWLFSTWFVDDLANCALLVRPSVQTKCVDQAIGSFSSQSGAQLLRPNATSGDHGQIKTPGMLMVAAGGIGIDGCAPGTLFLVFAWSVGGMV
jgi:hypothetical protein